MKKIFLVLTIGLFSSTLYSQYIENALRFSESDYGGTARFVGMGGAFGAIGGDFSSVAINPAGLGVYRSSEFVFSPGMSFDNNSSTYIGNTIDDSKYGVNFNNVSLVASYDLENSDSRWVNANFGVGFNRINDFNSNINFEGVNNNSLMEVFASTARETTDPDQLNGLREYLLWESGLLLFDSTAMEFYNEIDDEAYILVGTEWQHNPDFRINQRKLIKTEGSISEFNFAFGGNYAHKLYIGASIGITRLKFVEYASHYEYETNGFPIPEIAGFDFKENATTTGTGFNFKFGTIYKPVEFLRIGAALHIPTFYDLKEEYYNEVIGYYDNYPSEGSRSISQNYNYQLNTPLKAVFSAGFQIGKIAVIDVDYEYIDYSKMKLDDDDNSQYVVADNSEIKRIFQESHNIRAGGEFRYGSLYFRGGGKYSTSPYAKVDGVLNPSMEKMGYSGGIGYREKTFFVDFAFSQTILDYRLIAYDHIYNEEVADIKNKMNNFILTFGFKF